MILDFSGLVSRFWGFKSPSLRHNMPRLKGIKHSFKSTIRERVRIVMYFLNYNSIYIVAKRLNLDKRMVKYWVTKYMDASFHCKELGGNKRGTQYLLKIYFE